MITPAQAEINIDKLEGPVKILSYIGKWRYLPLTEADFLDPDFAKWAWQNIPTRKAMNAELAKYENTYLAWSDLVQKGTWDARGKISAKLGTPEYQAQSDEVEREFLKQSPNIEAIARDRDLRLITKHWQMAFNLRIPPYPEDRKAYEAYYCEKNKEHFTFLMDGCTIPVWEKPEPEYWAKRAYDYSKKKDPLEFLQKN